MAFLGCVGVVSPGEMGSGVGGALVAGGLRVVTVLDGRSARTVGLAERFGIEDVGSDDDLVEQADLILSILPPSEAVATAERFAAALRRTGASCAFADANAVAPATAVRMAEIIEDSGNPFVDAGIIGGPPPSPSNHIYASGPQAELVGQLAEHGLRVSVLDDQVGRASAMKMVFAGYNKGTQLLGAEIMTAARALGVYDALVAQLGDGPVDRLAGIERGASGIAPKAYRWVGEMEEIAATLDAVGLPGATYTGLAELCALIASTPLADEHPEDRVRRPLTEIVDVFVAALDARPGAEQPTG